MVLHLDTFNPQTASMLPNALIQSGEHKTFANLPFSLNRWWSWFPWWSPVNIRGKVLPSCVLWLRSTCCTSTVHRGIWLFTQQRRNPDSKLRYIYRIGSSGRGSDQLIDIMKGIRSDNDPPKSRCASYLDAVLSTSDSTKSRSSDVRTPTSLPPPLNRSTPWATSSLWFRTSAARASLLAARLALASSTSRCS